MAFDFIDSIVGAIAGAAFSKGGDREGPTVRDSIENGPLARWAEMNAHFASTYQQGVLPVLDLRPEHIFAMRDMMTSSGAGFKTSFVEGVKEIADKISTESNFDLKKLSSNQTREASEEILSLYSFSMLGQKAENITDQVYAKIKFFDDLKKLPRNVVSDEMLARFKPGDTDRMWINQYYKPELRNNQLDTTAASYGNLSDSMCVDINAMKTLVGEFNPSDSITKNLMAVYATSKDAGVKFSSYWPDTGTDADKMKAFENLDVRLVIQKSDMYKQAPADVQEKLMAYAEKRIEKEGINSSVGNFTADIFAGLLGEGRTHGRFATSIDAVKGSYGKTIAECQAGTFMKIDNALTDKFMMYLIEAYENNSLLPIPKSEAVSGNYNGQKIMTPDSYYSAREIFDSTEFWDKQNQIYKPYERGGEFTITKTQNPDTGVYEIAPGLSREKLWAVKQLYGYIAPGDMDGFRHYVGTVNRIIETQKVTVEAGGECIEAIRELPTIITHNGPSKELSTWQLNMNSLDDAHEHIATIANSGMLPASNNTLMLHFRNENRITISGIERFDFPQKHPEYIKGLGNNPSDNGFTRENPQINVNEITAKVIQHYNTQAFVKAAIRNEPADITNAANALHGGTKTATDKVMEKAKDAATVPFTPSTKSGLGKLTSKLQKAENEASEDLNRMKKDRTGTRSSRSEAFIKKWSAKIAKNAIKFSLPAGALIAASIYIPGAAEFIGTVVGGGTAALATAAVTKKAISLINDSPFAKGASWLTGALTGLSGFMYAKERIKTDAELLKGDEGKAAIMYSANPKIIFAPATANMQVKVNHDSSIVLNGEPYKALTDIKANIVKGDTLFFDSEKVVAIKTQIPNTKVAMEKDISLPFKGDLSVKIEGVPAKY